MTLTERALHRSHQPALLEDVVAGALDPGYAEAAERRRWTPRPRRRAGSVVLLLVGGLLLGLVLGRGRTQAPADSRARAALVTDVRARTAALDALTAQLDALRRQTAALQASVLTSTQAGATLDAQRRALLAGTAQTAVSGPGLAISVTETGPGPDVPANSGRRPAGGVLQGRVSDLDLQNLVNALWAAGAEAVAINGSRLSPTTAIRTAGSAILVDYRPVIAPYEILAVGDAGALQQRLRARGAAALDALDAIGARTGVVARPQLDLPAATVPGERLAEPTGGR